MTSSPVLIFGCNAVHLAFMDAYVCRECLSEGRKPGNVNTGGEILMPSESEGVVLLSLLKFLPDVWVPEDYLIVVRTKLLTS